MKNDALLVNKIFTRFPFVRYVALYLDNELIFKERDAIQNKSSSESDKYEEIIVNPTFLTLARQRGNIDCGGLEYLLIGYGNFNQLIKELEGGHISICLDKKADISKSVTRLLDFIKTEIKDT